MNKKPATIVMALSAIVLSSTLFGTTFASWAVTDNASTKNIRITASGNVKSLSFYKSYNGTAWGNLKEVLVSEGDSIDPSDIPAVSESGYTFKGWSIEEPSSTVYSATYTNSDLVSLSVLSDLILYPILESSSDYAYADSIYYQANVDVEINASSIGNTKLGKRYVGINGIPNPVASWDSSRDLYSASGIYKFQNDGGGAQVYRKIGFKPNSNWGGSWDGTPGFGIYAWQGDNNISIHMGQSSGSTTLYTYIPASYENFKFSRYSHNESGFVWGNQSANLSFDNSWWWGGSGTNKYSKSSIVLSMETWENWIDNWPSSDATWIS